MLLNYFSGLRLIRLDELYIYPRTTQIKYLPDHVVLLNNNEMSRIFGI